MLFHNANILSFHKGFNNATHDSLFVENNKIKAIGCYHDLKPLVNDETKMVDLKGKTIMPSFNDTHIHVWKVGNLKTFMLDVRGVSSLDEMLAMLEIYIKQNPHQPWITARGFNEADFKDGKMPTKTDLDKISTTTSIYIIRTCAHIAVCNSKALEICGITKHTVSPLGGMIYKGNDGKPNGQFAETAIGLITKHIPPYSQADLKVMVQAATTELHKNGITAATDPAVDPLLLDTYYQMYQQNQLNIRLNAFPIILPDGSETPYPMPDYYNSDGFKVNTVKFFSDGGLSGKTASLKRAYKNSTDNGVLRLKRNQYKKLALNAIEKGLGIATHAIGDNAIEFVIDVYKELYNADKFITNRIEHLGLPDKKHLQAMQAYHIATSMQTIFINELGKNFIKYLDTNYLNNCYPVKSVLEHKIAVALSSDAPVVKNINPFKGIEAAVFRQDDSGNIIAKDEAISLSQALKLYTENASVLSKNNLTGSLAVGNFADLIVLNKNPLQADLRDVKVEQTYFNGNCVFNIN
ncbi:MAG: amidohydrolase [Sphingobacteriales bacterium]|nr:MAG: amidohydrolase [Sphingobacteriales bacterium]TAF78271.1 MAG: amidohydrolase [Sphingobacteriales bacterium]